MFRAFVETGLTAGSSIVLPERESHHLSRVLRAGPGTLVEALNGRGDVARTEVESVGRKGETSLRILHVEHKPGLPCRLTLMQAIPKGKNMEWIVEKATELGVSRIVPLTTERTVVQLDGSDSGNKVERWRATAIDAIKQCGSPWLPDIHGPIPMTEALANWDPTGLAVFGSFAADAKTPRDLCVEAATLSGSFPREIAVWIGPEGDFSPSEILALRKAGVRPMTLGPLVLRVETAAICALSILGAESWR